jgi:hypothetical protein
MFCLRQDLLETRDQRSPTVFQWGRPLIEQIPSGRRGLRRALGIRRHRGRGGDTSDCHFRKTATNYDRKPGKKRLNCTAK